jgi:hypothetical protein
MALETRDVRAGNKKEYGVGTEFVLPNTELRCQKLFNCNMRLVKISVPAGWGGKVRNTAFSVGVGKLSLTQCTDYSKDGGTEQRDLVDIQASTPKAKQLVDAILAADYYDAKKVSFYIRQPRSVISNQDMKEITAPLVEPATDLFEELWQFNHVTYGLLGRILIAAILLAHGMIEGKILFIIGGLLFLPILPMIMGVSYGIVGRRYKLAAQSFAAFGCSMLALVVGGTIVAIFSSPPIRFDDLGTVSTGIIISAAVGIAAALAAIDDAGRRELIGLAAASQIALIPIWLGILIVHGLPPDTSVEDIAVRILSFAANFCVQIVTIICVQIATGVHGEIRQVDM